MGIPVLYVSSAASSCGAKTVGRQELQGDLNGILLIFVENGTGLVVKNMKTWHACRRGGRKIYTRRGILRRVYRPRGFSQVRH